MIQCPKCKAVSGDDWSQCRGLCPMPGSPHYKPDTVTRVQAMEDLANHAKLHLERCLKRRSGGWKGNNGLKDWEKELLRLTNRALEAKP